MTNGQREHLQKEREFYLILLDYYARNRENVKSMTDKEYEEHIDAILDEINRIDDMLENDNLK